jgi:molecular chaperone IbpA
VKVVGATLADGVLQVDLERELPEAMKPRRIAVESKPASATKVAQGTKMLEAAEKAA